MRSAEFRSGRPEPGEFASYAQADIDAVQGDDAVTALRAQRLETVALFRAFGDVGGDLTYAPGKWSVKQVLGHLADDERIFAYRLLCVARGDSRPLPGFDETAYVNAAGFERLALDELLNDYEAVRNATITLLLGLEPEAWLRRGLVNGYPATPRGLAFHIAGHELHHHRVLHERYVPIASELSWWPVRRAQ
jgi:uncharacterized damage-inducible protein DinB